MTKELATTVNLTPEERALLLNDLSKLSPEQRSSLYVKVCQSVGLNPLTQPFAYLQLNGKLVLYAQRNCTDQLRSLHNVSVTISSRSKIDDLYVVTAKAKLESGREDESIGAVSIGNLKGDALANAIMKGETKAKRRVTLSICGLSFLDETEVETIKDAKVIPADPISQLPQSSPQTGSLPTENGPYKEVMRDVAGNPIVSNSNIIPTGEPHERDDDLDVALGSQPDQAFDFPPESFDDFPEPDDSPPVVEPYRIPLAGPYQGKTLEKIPTVQLRAYLNHVIGKSAGIVPKNDAQKALFNQANEFIDKAKYFLSAKG